VCSFILAVQDARARYGVLKGRGTGDSGAPDPKVQPFHKGAGIRGRNTPSELHRVPSHEREVEGWSALTVQARKAAIRGPSRTSIVSSQWFTESRSRSGSI